MDDILVAEGVSRAFSAGGQAFYALRGVTARIPRGRLTVLRGRSGSGKTTLINILGALDRPTAGAVRFDGQDILALGNAARDKLRRRRIGFVFQSVALISTMSAYENVEFGLRVAGVPWSEQRPRAERCMALVGLEHRVHHRTQELSGGEQQRVAIARAIAHRPQLVFADEPTAELDTATGLQVVRLFKQIIAEEGITIVMTSHDPLMVEVADHVIHLEDGMVAEGGDS